MYEGNSGGTLGRCSVLIQSRCLDIWVLGNQGPRETTYFFYPDGKHLLLLKDPQGFWVVRLALASFCFCRAVFYCLEMEKGGKASKCVQPVIRHTSPSLWERGHKADMTTGLGRGGWRAGPVAKSKHQRTSVWNPSTHVEWLRGTWNSSSRDLALFWPQWALHACVYIPSPIQVYVLKIPFKKLDIFFLWQ